MSSSPSVQLPRLPDPEGAPDGGRGGGLRRPPGWAFPALVAAATALGAWAARGITLYWDDYLFLRQAQEYPLSRNYLALDLFQHFSPVSRLGDKLAVHALPGTPELVFWVIITMYAVLCSSTTFLMLSLFGRTWLSWVLAASCTTSLSVYPVLNWWTAGLNILPAMACTVFGFGAVVRYLRGGTVWWGVAAITGYTIAVLDYETAMLLPFYLGIWFLLFFRGLSDHLGFWRQLGRSWWLWAALGLVGALSAMNYKVNYYVESKSATTSEIGEALYISLVRTFLPSLVGVHSATGNSFLTWGVLLSLAVLAASLVVSFRRSTAAWRGWLFATLGWLLPSMALILNRVGLYGTQVANNLIYYLLAVIIAGIGCGHALRATPQRAGTRPGSDRTVGRRPWAAALVLLLAVLVVVNTTLSFRSTLSNRGVSLGARAFSHTFDANLAAVSARGPVSLLDRDLNPLVPAAFAPYNRASRILPVRHKGLIFDAPGLPLYAITDSGSLHPATIEPRESVKPSDGRGSLAVTDAEDSTTDLAKGLCFTSTGSSAVAGKFAAPVIGPDLAVITSFSVSADTSPEVLVASASAPQLEAANYDPKTWQRGDSKILDTVRAKELQTVVIRGFRRGTHVCVSDITAVRVDASS